MYNTYFGSKELVINIALPTHFDGFLEVRSEREMSTMLFVADWWNSCVLLIWIGGGV